MRTHPMTAISDYMLFMECTKRSKDHGEEAELEPKAFMRGFWASREVEGADREVAEPPAVETGAKKVAFGVGNHGPQREQRHSLSRAQRSSQDER